MGIKELMQKRDALVAEMNALIAKADEETRTLNSDESEEFEKLEAQLAELDDTIEKKRALEELETRTQDANNEPEEKEDDNVSKEELEARAFEEYIRTGNISTRANTNMTKSDNGAVIPETIARKIIDKVVEICPIFKDAERYNVKGTLTIPKYDSSTSDITMTYADEFTDGESTSGKFTSISLTGFLGRAITDVSKSLINNSEFDIVSFVENKMAEAIARFIEHELLKGTTDKIDGLTGVEQVVTAAAATAVTSDEIIDLQEQIPDVFQGNAYFIMNKATRTAIRKLKDGEGNYLLNKDFNARWGYTLLGKDVFTSDNMDKMEAGKIAIYYGDMTGLAVKVSEDINIDVLFETKARQHAVEVLGFVELDAKVQNVQKIAALKMKASA